MPERVVWACFELLWACYGTPKVPKSLEKGAILGPKMGQKQIIPKIILEHPVGMLQQVISPVFTQSKIPNSFEMGPFGGQMKNAFFQKF